ncbi:hypothetical protein V8G54_025879 [Vigna mungo]|uniref:TF-B3 domain-containing protein n=1 Tax=Vigna mungo TaxID=3915 RepID=A0AAQ3MZS8_VIGMU
MEDRRRKHGGGSSKRESKHFLKVILPSAIHADQMRIPEEFIKRFGDELSTVATITVPDGRVWKMRLKKYGKDVFFGSTWREFVNYYSIGYGSHLIFRYVGNSKFRVLIFDITAAEICYPLQTRGTNKPNWKRSKFENEQHHGHETKKKTRIVGNGVETKDEDDVNLIRPSETKGRKKKRDFSHGKQVKSGGRGNHSFWEIGKDVATASDRLMPRNPSVTCTIKSSRLYVSTEFACKYLKPGVGMMLQNSNGEQWDVSCSCHSRCRALIISRGWKKFMRDNDLSEGDQCLLELIKRDPIVLKCTVPGEA